MSSIVRRVLQRFMKPTYFVGRDLEGNKYYEHPNANDGRPKRSVQYKRTDDMWTYIASGKRLPVQWSAWLTHTRSDPPSLKELQADLARQHRVQMNAAILEARDNEARTGIDQSSSVQVPGPDPHVETESERGLRRSKPLANVRSDGDSPPIPVRDPWGEVKRGSDEPQSWRPVVRRK